MMQHHFTMLARYNAWANARLYDAAGRMGADYGKDAGAFFGSMHGTLNHILVADRIWLRRLTGEGPEHARLDERPYDDLASLREAREAEDGRIVALIASLSDDDLSGSFTYTPITDPEPVTQRRAPVLTHVFNHQTHHRGQAHTILTSLGHEGPAMDLIYFQREARLGTA